MTVETAAPGVGRNPAIPAVPLVFRASCNVRQHRGSPGHLVAPFIRRDLSGAPPHVAIYRCGVLAGVSSAYLILTTTWGRTTNRDRRRVRSSGAFAGRWALSLPAWGGAAMLASAPFDDWWHSAYGLDVRSSPAPHGVAPRHFSRL